MSDTDDGDDGDDGFDKEAEREKLREQYEREQQRREATQQMSDLLLKGATMTNTHCDDCGSPIFRYEGEAFCPTCAGTREVVDEGDESGGSVDQSAGAGQPGSQPAGAGQGDAGQQGTGQQDAGPGAGESRTAGAGGQAGADAGGQPDVDAGRDVAGASSSPGSSGDAPAGSGDTTAGDDGGTDPGDLEARRARLDERVGSRSPNAGGPDRRSDSPRSTGSPVRSGEVPSMAQSRASLRRAIVSLSEQAAQSDDPGRAHDLLKGAREAAEALAALEGTTGE